MHTSVLLVALLGPGAAPHMASEALEWQTSYQAALVKARETGKPVAILVGAGLKGWQNVTTEELSAEARKLLTSEYICVYLDVSQPKGRALANALEINTDKGLVLSTKDAKSQAFWHNGSLTNFELARCLQRYAVTGAVTRTEVLSETRLASAPVTESVVPPTTTVTAIASGSVVPSTIISSTIAPTTTIPATTATVMTAPSIGSIPYATIPATTSYVPYSGHVAPAMVGSVYAPNYGTPMMAAPSYVVPSYAPMYAPSFGGGCANGRCGR